MKKEHKMTRDRVQKFLLSGGIGAFCLLNAIIQSLLAGNLAVTIIIGLVGAIFAASGITVLCKSPESCVPSQGCICDGSSKREPIKTEKGMIVLLGIGVICLLAATGLSVSNIHLVVSIVLTILGGLFVLVGGLTAFSEDEKSAASLQEPFAANSAPETRSTPKKTMTVKGLILVFSVIFLCALAATMCSFARGHLGVTATLAIVAGVFLITFLADVSERRESSPRKGPSGVKLWLRKHALIAGCVEALLMSVTLPGLALLIGVIAFLGKQNYGLTITFGIVGGVMWMAVIVALYSRLGLGEKDELKRLVRKLGDAQYKKTPFGRVAYATESALSARDQLIAAGADAVPLVIDCLTGGGPYNKRALAAQVLGEIGDPRAVKPLIRALKDREITVRGYSAEALGKCGDERALAPLREMIAGEEAKSIAAGYAQGALNHLA